MKIRPMGAELLDADGQTDSHDARGRLWQSCESALNHSVLVIVFWLVTSSHLAGGYKRFAGMCYLHFQRRTSIQAPLNLQVARQCRSCRSVVFLTRKCYIIKRLAT